MRLPRLIGLLATAVMVASGCAHGPIQPIPSTPLIRGEAPRFDDQEHAAQPLPPEETARLLVVHGDKLVEKGRESLALAQYEKARALLPDHPGLAHKLALLYDRLAQDQKASSEYRRALQQQPRDPALLNDFGYFHYQRGRYAEAEKYLRQALEICEHGGGRWWLLWKWLSWKSPHSSESQENLRDRVCVNLGLALAQQGRYQEAFATFTKVLTPAQAHYNLAVVMLQQAGHLPLERQADQARLQEQARSHLQQALKLDGSLRQAHALSNELENPEPRVPPDPPALDKPKSEVRSRNSDRSASAPRTATGMTRRTEASSEWNSLLPVASDRTTHTSEKGDAAHPDDLPSGTPSANVASSFARPVEPAAPASAPRTAESPTSSNTAATGQGLPTHSAPLNTGRVHVLIPDESALPTVPAPRNTATPTTIHVPPGAPPIKNRTPPATPADSGKPGSHIRIIQLPPDNTNSATNLALPETVGARHNLPDNTNSATNSDLQPLPPPRKKPVRPTLRGDEN